ncbi:MAG: aldo/keto reductase [Phycisphaeraceae bacterium]|nr:aldo/keto reductase [Phycisphaeraceae bacterium]
MGCWAIGGPYCFEGNPNGWGIVDDDESVHAIHRAIDTGVNFFDTADLYGCGRSERVLAKTLDGKHGDVVITTKFGYKHNEPSRQASGICADPVYIRNCCERSLNRLERDHIDLYQFHVGSYGPDDALTARDVLEELVAEGKIRWYGWSTDKAKHACVFAAGQYCTAIQHLLNVLSRNPEALLVCEEHNLASINKNPLGKGILTGKFSHDSCLPTDDFRQNWNFQDGKQAIQLKQLETIREILSSEGRTPGQGALAWIWARCDKTIPIPGFKTIRQVKENANAMQFGPLQPGQMTEIETILGR